jgi:arsenate reductase (thioredoxin)
VDRLLAAGEAFTGADGEHEVLAGLLSRECGLQRGPAANGKGAGELRRAARGLLQTAEKVFTRTEAKVPTDMKKRVLFICVHNSARSQIAEAWLNELCGDEFEAHSAGLEPGQLNLRVVQAMQEVGIDISGHPTQRVFDVWKSGKAFAYVITVCDQASAERCPIFPGVTQRLDWSFPDPSAATGGSEAKLAEARRIRNLLKAKVESWCAEMCEVAGPISPEFR